MFMKKLAIGIATISAIANTTTVGAQNVGVNSEILSYATKNETKEPKKEGTENNYYILYTNCAARLRSQSNTESEILNVYPINTEIHSYGTEDGWDYVEVDGIKGYINSKLLSETLTEIQPQFQNRWGISLSEEEKNTLAKILWLEARGESYDGQVAVVEVVFNRIIDNEYPNTLWEVISQPSHFSSYPIINTAHPEQTQYQVIEDVLNGKSNILSKGVVYFSTTPRNENIVAHIGGHYFCGK